MTDHEHIEHKTTIGDFTEQPIEEATRRERSVRKHELNFGDAWDFAPAPESVKVNIDSAYGHFINGEFTKPSGGGKSFATIDDMFDPAANALYAAGFLHDLFEETGDWELAAGAYHSRTPEHAEVPAARLCRDAGMRGCGRRVMGDG